MTNKEQTFDFENESTDNKDVVNVSTEQTEDLQITTEVETVDENEVIKFRTFCEGKNYIIIDKKSVSHFLNLVSYHAHLGYDIYSSSFKMDVESLKEKNKVNLVYNNGNVLAMSEIEVKEKSGDWSSFIISIDNMMKVFTASQGYLLLYEEDKSIYGYVFGGKVFIETYAVDKDICSKDHLIKQLSAKADNKKEVSKDFVEVMRNLFELVHTGTRSEERALYFIDDNAYIYSGIVLGRFKGIGMNLTLQDVDVSTLVRFFFDVESNIEIEDFGVYMRYSYNGRSIYIGRRGLKLSDDMKYQSAQTESGVTVDSGRVKTIVNFLIGMGNNNGILDIDSDEKGVSLVCNQKVEEYFSSFTIDGKILGDGIKYVKIPLDILKNFLKVFKNEVRFQTVGNKLYIVGEFGEIVIFGNI